MTKYFIYLGMSCIKSQEKNALLSQQNCNNGIKKGQVPPRSSYELDHKNFRDCVYYDVIAVTI